MTEEKRLQDTIDIAVQTALSNVHTATVAKVINVNTNTIDVKVVLARVVDGVIRQIPTLIEVPVVFLSGGVSYRTYPIAVGDYALLIITERCFDTWWSGSDFLKPAENRKFDYSDAFAIVGVKNLASALTIPDEITDQGNITHNGNLTRTGTSNQTGDADITGDLTVIGDTDSTTYKVNGTTGWTGTFATGDARTATVVSGLITDVS